MKVSLIQPKMQRRPVDTSLKARLSPHLGLLTIAGLVRRAGHEVSVQNGNLSPVEIPDDADLVGITVTVDVLPQAIELAKLCREKRIPVVAGGIGVAADPDTAHVVFRPKGMTAQELYDGYLWIYREVYSWENILRRTPKSLSQFVPYYLFNLIPSWKGRCEQRRKMANNSTVRSSRSS